MVGKWETFPSFPGHQSKRKLVSLYSGHLIDSWPPGKVPVHDPVMLEDRPRMLVLTDVGEETWPMKKSAVLPYRKGQNT